MIIACYSHTQRSPIANDSTSNPTTTKIDKENKVEEEKCVQTECLLHLI